MKRKNTKTLFILIFCPLVFFILSRVVRDNAKKYEHTVFSALKNIQKSVDSREAVRVEERKNSETTEADKISDHQDVQSTVVPTVTVTVTQQQRQNISEEIELETCKSYDELPLNWKNDEPWNVGFVRAPKCPPRELIILINTAQKHTVNLHLLRNYFTELIKRGANISYFFLLGKSEEPLENFPDFVVGDFLDTYDNLILKTKTAYEYFEQYCNEANNFLLIDDDVVFNFGAIMNMLRKEEAQNVIYGERLDRQDAHTHPWLIKKGLEISLEQWEKPVWPDYIDGTCVFMTADSARKMGQVAAISRKAVTIPIEDLVFNGIIRAKACLDLENAKKFCLHLKGNTRKLKSFLQYKIDAL